MSMSNFLENKILNHIAGAEVYVAPEKCYLALIKTASTETEKGEEVTGLGYTRQPITFSTATDGVIANSTDIVYGVAEEDWGTVNGVAIMDSEVDGEMLFYTKLESFQNVVMDNQIVFKANNLTITLD